MHTYYTYFSCSYSAHYTYAVVAITYNIHYNIHTYLSLVLVYIHYTLENGILNIIAVTRGVLALRTAAFISVRNSLYD